MTKIKIQKCSKGAIIDGTPYSFQRKGAASAAALTSVQEQPVYQKMASIQEFFKSSVEEWEQAISTFMADDCNIFLSSNDFALVNKMIKDIGEQIKTTEVKLSNIVMMLK